MHFEKLPKGPAPLVRVRLNIEESFLAASSAFVGMSPGVDVQTRVRSGQIGDVALGRSQDNAFFLNQYRASVQEAEVLLAARVVGDVHHEELVVKPLLVRPDAFMAVGTNRIAEHALAR